MKKLFKNKKFLMALAILPIGTIAFLLYKKFTTPAATTGAAGSTSTALPAGSTVAGTGSAPLSDSLVGVGTGSGGGSSGTPATNTTTPPPAGSPDETPHAPKNVGEVKALIKDNKVTLKDELVKLAHSGLKGKSLKDKKKELMAQFKESTQTIWTNYSKT